MTPEIFEPNSELTGFVKRYWTLESEKENTPEKNTIIPDGTMKLIFHYGDTYNANSTFDRIEIIETFLLNKLTERHTIDNIMKSTVETILRANGQFSASEFSKKNGVNRRQLVRKFSSIIGLTPKQLSKTIRIQATLISLLTKEVKTLTDLAYENNYFIQKKPARLPGHSKPNYNLWTEKRVIWTN